MTFFELINAMLKASREGDVILKYAILEELDKVEPTYPDLLDAIGY